MEKFKGYRMQTKNTKSKKVNTITAKLLISEVKKKFKAKEVKKVKETNYLLGEFNGLDVGLSIKRMREI